MKTIYRYTVPVDDTSRVMLQEGAEVISVGKSRGEEMGYVSLWAVVDPERPKKARTLVFRGTGHPLKGNEGRFLGTVDYGLLVWHVFELEEKD